MFRLMLFCCILISGCKNKAIGMMPDPVITADTSRHTYTYLALGDSYTIGESVPEAERFPVQVVQLLREQQLDIATPRIVATTGWTTDELQAGIKAAHIQPSYDVVTLLIGVNDQYRGRSVEEYRPLFTVLLDQAIDFAGGHPERVVVISIPDWGATPYAAGRNRELIAKAIDAFNAANESIAASKKVAYLDITPGSRKAATDHSLVAPDGLHPSGKEYTAWAKGLAPLLKKALGK
jgi:lysophospholipase L1-like esterase